jgi:peptide subunit release factor 1 (eRF1)
LIGRFPAEVARARPEEIRRYAEAILGDWRNKRCGDLVRETLTQARGNGRGVTGLRRVLHALELGEVRTLLVGDRYTSQAVECSGCGHLDAHLVSSCPVCGRPTRKVVDVAEAILPWVIRNDVELFYVKDDPEFDRIGNVAALLRFRSEQSRMRALSVDAARPSLGRQDGLVGRYRGLAGRRLAR